MDNYTKRAGQKFRMESSASVLLCVEWGRPSVQPRKLTCGDLLCAPCHSSLVERYILLCSLVVFTCACTHHVRVYHPHSSTKEFTCKKCDTVVVVEQVSLIPLNIQTGCMYSFRCLLTQCFRDRAIEHDLRRTFFRATTQSDHG